MKKFTKAAALGTTALISGLVASTGAFAQGIDTITVTSQKREQTLQDTPVSVAVVDEVAIQESQVRDAADLQILVPSLRVSEFAASTNTQFDIRGIGTSSFNPGLEPSVGVFIDGIYRPNAGAAINDLLGVERVEVLRGPQSTLFGRNTPGGVVSIVTKQPEFEFGAEAALTIGNYDTRIFQGAITGPISDTIAYRIDYNNNEAGGYLENFDGRDLNDRNRETLRGQLYIEPSDNISLRLIADTSSIDENCCAAPFAQYDPIDLLGLTTLAPVVLPADPFGRNEQAAIDGIVNTTLDQDGFSAELNWDFDNFVFTYIGSRRTYDEMQDIDADFSTLDLAGRRLINNEYTSTTHELRFTSTGDNTIDWMAGAFFYDLDQDYTNNTPLGSDLRPFFDLVTGLDPDVNALVTGFGFPSGTGLPTFLEVVINGNNLAGVGLLPGFTNPSGSALPLVPTEGYMADGSGLIEEDYDYNISSAGFFAQFDWHLTDRATLTVGGRYSDEEKDVTGDVLIDDAISALNYVQLGQDLRVIDPAFCLPGALTNPAVGGNGCAFLVPVVLLSQAQANPALIPVLQSVGFDPLDPFRAFTPLTTEQAQNPALNALLGFGSVLTLNEPLPPGGYPDLNRSDDNFSYNVTFGYDLTDNMNVYAAYRTGYKPGSFNISSDAAATGIFEVDEETTDSWEIGIKGTAADNTFRYAVTYFDQTIEDFQSENFVGSGFALQNAGEIHVAGFEVEAAWAPTSRLFFNGGFTLLTDNEYESFRAGPCPDVPVATCYTGFPLDDAGNPDPTRPFGTYNDLTGQERGNSKFVGSLSTTYTHPIGDTMELRLRHDFYHSDEYALVTGLDERAIANQEPFTINNASIALGDMNGGWEVRFWGRNIFEEDYVKGGFPSVGLPGTSFNRYPGDPRTYGVTLRVRR